ncbi:MAG: hypothetical protein LBU89_06060 [Fibromonadaceae bacterium]|jgi:hypothetical protein|nr:hypothetical protein [Fibromonadaceae bacterium]
MRFILKIFLAVILCVKISSSTVLAVLEIIPNSDLDMTVSEYRHLTDELRTRARAILPRSYSVLTRDNIFQMLPPESEQAESSAVSIGRAIDAEYVTQGFVGKFEGMLTLTIELYESASGKMLNSFVTESETARGLLSEIRTKTPELLSVLQPVTNNVANLSPVERGELKVESDDNSQFSILNSQLSNTISNEKPKTPFYTALALDLLGAAAIGFGIYQNSNAQKLYKKYENMDKNLNNNEYKNAYREVESAKTDRDILYTVGGVLLTMGIMVHVWF